MTLNPSKKSHTWYMPVDRKGNVIQSWGGIKTTNWTVSSPLTVAWATTQAIAIPINAIEIVLLADVDLQVSEDSDMVTYFTLPSWTILPVWVAWVDNIYVEAAAEVDIDFYFNMLVERAAIN